MSSKDVFGNVFQKITTLEDIIKVKGSQLQTYPSAGNRVTLSKVEVDLKNYLRLEEEFWRKKGRRSGLKKET